MSRDEHVAARDRADSALWRAHRDEGVKLRDGYAAEYRDDPGATDLQPTSIERRARRSAIAVLKTRYPDEYEQLRAGITIAQPTTPRTYPLPSGDQREAALYVCSRHTTADATHILRLLGIVA